MSGHHEEVTFSGVPLTKLSRLKAGLHCWSQESDFAFFKNPLLWDHLVFSTIPPLHRFPLAEKTRSSYHALKGSDSLLRQQEDSHVGRDITHRIVPREACVESGLSLLHPTRIPEAA